MHAPSTPPMRVLTRNLVYLIASRHCVVKKILCVLVDRTRLTSRRHASRASWACTSSTTIPSPNCLSSTPALHLHRPQQRAHCRGSRDESTSRFTLSRSASTAELYVSATSARQRGPTCTTSPQRSARGRRSPTATCTPSVLKYSSYHHHNNCVDLVRNQPTTNPRTKSLFLRGGRGAACKFIHLCFLQRSNRRSRVGEVH